MANYRLDNYRLTYVPSLTAAMSLSMPLLLVFDDAGGEQYSLELVLGTRAAKCCQRRDFARAEIRCKCPLNHPSEPFETIGAKVGKWGKKTSSGR
jgi:hypothetical protein